MRRAWRWLGAGFAVVVAVVAGGAGYLYLAFPIAVKAPSERVEPTAELRERGAYLAEHVALCMDCHSARDFSRFSGPVVPGTFGQGGQRFGHDLGLPGELYAPNITPYALSDWSDGEIVRALTSGVTPEGRALFPMMNYPAFSQLCRRDLEALVVYVRRLAPVEHTPPASELDFPVNLIARTLPKPAEIAERCPDPKDGVAYGRYLVNAAGCADCHTPRKDGAPVAELAFSGGVPLPLPNGGKVHSKNITPDAETGIGSWSREAFLARFATYRDAQNLHAVSPGEFNTLMPWSMYAGMSDRDLGAIYDFLRTIKPIKVEGARVAVR